MTELVSLITVGSILVGVVIFVMSANTETLKSISRVYQRLDDVKLDQELKYTSKEICHERVDRLSQDVAEIKADVKKLLFKNGINDE